MGDDGGAAGAESLAELPPGDAAAGAAGTGGRAQPGMGAGAGRVWRDCDYRLLPQRHAGAVVGESAGFRPARRDAPAGSISPDRAAAALGRADPGRAADTLIREIVEIGNLN